MAISNAIANFSMTVHPELLAKAKALEPKLYERTILPQRIVSIAPDGTVSTVQALPDGQISAGPYTRRDKVSLDFGEHMVGYLSLTVESTGSPMDAPCFLQFRFGERPLELVENPDDYDGEISRSWIQEERIHLDRLPATLELPRRFAFRYLEITVLDTSAKYQAILKDISVRTVTSADMSLVPPLHTNDPLLQRLDQVSLATMRDCMQSVFEDGPKRDQRLWLADLRLQALTGYTCVHSIDLAKRCLYLFAALTQNEGRVGACLFHNSDQVDDTALFDYSLFFVTALLDYWQASGDRETLEELFPTAQRQIELSLMDLDERGIVRDKDTWWCFLDWGEGLNKQAGAQAILIFALKQAKEMAEILGKADLAKEWADTIEKLTAASLTHLWDAEQGFFVSGAQRQVSWASQVWFVLAGVFDRDDNARLLKRLQKADPSPQMVTPYMNHYYIQALLDSGLKDDALAHLKHYWGAMLDAGADTFWEIFDPEDPTVSPYGSQLINSYCHAWSGTPSYFIRNYFSD